MGDKYSFLCVILISQRLECWHQLTLITHLFPLLSITASIFCCKLTPLPNFPTLIYSSLTALPVFGLISLPFKQAFIKVNSYVCRLPATISDFVFLPVFFLFILVLNKWDLLYTNSLWICWKQTFFNHCIETRCKRTFNYALWTFKKLLTNWTIKTFSTFVWTQNKFQRCQNNNSNLFAVWVFT